jgi:hypothetical protein
MRFAFKTAPPNTTWRDMLAVWLPGVAAGRPARIAPGAGTPSPQGGAGP